MLGKQQSMPPAAPPKPGLFTRISQLFMPGSKASAGGGAPPPPPPDDGGGGGFLQGLLARASMAPPSMPRPAFLNRMTMKMGFGGGGNSSGNGGMGTRGSVPMAPPSSPPPGGNKRQVGNSAGGMKSMVPGPPPRTTVQRQKYGPSSRAPMVSMPMPPPSTPPPNRRGNSRMVKASMPPPRGPPPNRGQSRMMQQGGGIPASPRGNQGMRESVFNESDFYGDDDPVLEVVEVEEQPDAYGGPGTDFAFIVLIRLKDELREVDRFVRDFQDFDQYLRETYPGILNFQLPLVEPVPRIEDIDYCVEQLQMYLDELSTIQYLVLDLADFLDVDPAELNEALYDSDNIGNSQYDFQEEQQQQQMRQTRGASRYQSRATRGVGGAGMLGSPGGGMSPLMSQIQTGARTLNHVSRRPQQQIPASPQFGGGFGSPAAAAIAGNNDMMNELKRKVEERLNRIKEQRGGRPMTYMPSTNFGQSVPNYEPNYIPSRRVAPSKRFTARQLPSMRMNNPPAGGGKGYRQSRFIRLPAVGEGQQYQQYSNLPGV